MQPKVKTLFYIAKMLNVDGKELLIFSKNI